VSNFLPNQYSLKPASAHETERIVTIPIEKSCGSGETVYVSTLESEGFLNANYFQAHSKSTVVFDSADKSKNIVIKLNNDAVPNGTRTFGVIVQRNPGDPPAKFLAKTTFTILNDDDWRVDAGIATEGSPITIFVWRQGQDTTQQTVYLSTTEDAGFANNNDFGGLTDHALAFDDSPQQKQLSLTTIDDANDEPDKTFGVVLRDEQGRLLAQAQFTIFDNDDPPTPPPQATLLRRQSLAH
jgi:hypothetical protein